MYLKDYTNNKIEEIIAEFIIENFISQTVVVISDKEYYCSIEKLSFGEIGLMVDGVEIAYKKIKEIRVDSSSMVINKLLVVVSSATKLTSLGVGMTRELKRYVEIGDLS